MLHRLVASGDCTGYHGHEGGSTSSLCLCPSIGSKVLLHSISPLCLPLYPSLHFLNRATVPASMDDCKGAATNVFLTTFVCSNGELRAQLDKVVASQTVNANGELHSAVHLCIQWHAHIFYLHESLIPAALSSWLSAGCGEMLVNTVETTGADQFGCLQIHAESAFYNSFLWPVQGCGQKGSSLPSCAEKYRTASQPPEPK